MSVAISNLCPENPSMLVKQIYKAVSEDKKHTDISYERTSDEEIACLIRSGFSICYNGMWGAYRVSWGKV